MRKIEQDLIIPFAKQAGMTSFDSLWQVKHALKTKKLGHTGTLDSFADGLLVLLSGKLTRLAGRITDFDKTYITRMEFGKQTDTLDPEGEVIDMKELPQVEAFFSVLDSFTGVITQIPPLYSAVKIKGQRASDRMRQGEAVVLKERSITIYSLRVVSLESDGKTADPSAFASGALLSAATLEVSCSKGTYIRSLVRDIAAAAGSCAFVSALRRTAVGPFMLAEAAGYDKLVEFGKTESEVNQSRTQLLYEEIKAASKTLDTKTAKKLGFPVVEINRAFVKNFFHGQKIQKEWFNTVPASSGSRLIAVFSCDNCIGLIKNSGNSFNYDTVFQIEGM
ncbi:tRNA pseudouridine(55) synthase TruB [Treponema phagedenis]|uniref:tRNA pseudouridine synthase B n=1 Tax=Treponema phagedenis TaxID=162 RepID=A0A0B7GYY1_TREPH|nr:tRNA pseudouridine(55) synthase TruB [Treponema phagedenis]NVP25272.1 tRNA pseudouridine(55) synthase TruB [Treponema phagedenis]QEJ93982.1 tRNA pseudouridine(55) synthase TruB [Treponema phagedenis]QEJ97050.1 tRNA pseudouridine(55) synthase TruB [Treponema phagedenis]QEK02010.1 tRNA pseudouridine(55) synthase TruB [Treponema phagedenis]QEK02960.1 tRNA pseudouridine(55) synthase TruB [Treponema phagedenis]